MSTTTEINLVDTLFTLVPCNDEAHALVKAQLGNTEIYNDVKCISVYIIFQSKTPGRLLTFGIHNTSDVVLPRYSSYSFYQCFFTYSHDGELVLQDSSDDESTAIGWWDDGAQVEKVTMRGNPRRCAIPHATPNRILFEIGKKAQFDFIWRLDPTPDRVPLIRIKLAQAYHQKYRKYNVPMEDKQDRAMMEVKTRYTPEIPRSVKPRNRIETYNYKKIGSGGFGSVYDVVDLAVGELLAMKVARGENRDRRRERWKIAYKNEVEKLANLQHPRIVRFVHSQGWTEGLPVQIFLELYAGNAREFFHNPRHACGDPIPRHDRIPINQAYCIDHVLCGLDFLHRKGFVHRDVKPENILYKFNYWDSRVSFVLSDLGCTTRINNIRDTAGSVQYMSPETTRSGKYTPLSDIYSFGITVLELLCLVHVDERLGDVEVWRDKLEGCLVADPEGYEDAPPPRRRTVAMPEMEPSHARIQYLLDHDLIDAGFRTLVHMDPSHRGSAMSARLALIRGPVREDTVLYNSLDKIDEVPFGCGKLRDANTLCYSYTAPVYTPMATAPNFRTPSVPPQPYSSPYAAPPSRAPPVPPQFAGGIPFTGSFGGPPPARFAQYAPSEPSQSYMSPPSATLVGTLSPGQRPLLPALPVSPPAGAQQRRAGRRQT